MKLRLALPLVVLPAIYGACQRPPLPQRASDAPPPPASSSAEPVASAPPPEPPKPEPPKPVVAWTEGLATPESVLVDEAGDRYLVSNINGKPLDADNNGYISELSPDGKVVKAKLFAGGEGKVELDAPKGMGLVGTVLYVADITQVRRFDLKTGKQRGSIKIKDATFLNDVAVGADGKVYVSDTGMKAGAADFEPSGTDAVYVIDKEGKVKPVAKKGDLGRPNGLFFTPTGVFVVTFGGPNLFRLDDKGEKQDATTLPEGGLDGIAAIGDEWLVSSWGGKAIFRGKAGGTFTAVLSMLEAPADIAYDAKRKRVIVPRFMGNAVEAYDLP